MRIQSQGNKKLKLSFLEQYKWTHIGWMLPALLCESNEVMQIYCCHEQNLLLVLEKQRKNMLVKTKQMTILQLKPVIMYWMRITKLLWTLRHIHPFSKLILQYRQKFTGCGITQAISCRLLTTETWDKFQSSPCEICGRQCSTREGCPPYTSDFSPNSFSVPMTSFSPSSWHSSAMINRCPMHSIYKKTFSADEYMGWFLRLRVT